MSDLLRAIMRRISSGRNIRGQKPEEPVKENYRNFYLDDDAYGNPTGGTRDVSAYSVDDAQARKPNITVESTDPFDYSSYTQKVGFEDTGPMPSAHNVRKARNDIAREEASPSDNFDTDRHMIRVLADIIGRKQRGRIVDDSPHYDPHNRRITGSLVDEP